MSAISDMGSRVLVRIYQGIPYELVSPFTRVGEQEKHLREWRKDLVPEGPMPTLVTEYDLKYATTSSYGTTYDDPLVQLFVAFDWQLTKELAYGFTTGDRWDTAKEIPMPLLESAVAGNKWVFAKTMPQNPHEYTLRKDWADPNVTFDQLVLHIRKYGYTQKYFRTSYRCCNIGDHFYWSMGAPLPITILVNRKKIHGNPV